MLWSVWIVAGAAFVAIFILFLIEDRKGHGLAVSYRQNYVKLTSRLETLVNMANKMEPVAQKTQNIKVYDTYHSYLKMLETLLEAVRLIPPFSAKTVVLQAPMFLANDLWQRFTSLDKELSRVKQGQNIQLKSHEAPAVGCYFCSRPFDALSFHKVRVKVDGVTQDVASCSICNAKLLSGKKAKVLFFSENNETVHWSKAKEYIPSAQFWNINESEKSDEVQPLKTGSHLTLVYSNVTHLNSKTPTE